MANAKRYNYTPEQIQFLKDNVKGHFYEDLRKMFNQHFDLELTLHQIKGCVARHKLTNGLNTRLQKGRTPHNKGKKFPGKTNKTSFKKGRISHNYKPIGSERVEADGYTWVKIAQPSVWKPKNILVWEEVNGPVPDGHVLIFLDGNKQNSSIENLQLITRGQFARMNQNHLHTTDPESTKTGVILADIYTKIGQRKKELKQADRI